LVYEDDDESEEEVSKGKFVKWEVLDELFSQLTLADAGNLERMFVVQIAIEEGWQMAKEVSLYQSGIGFKLRRFNQFVSLALHFREICEPILSESC